MAPELTSSLRYESLHVCGVEGVVEGQRVEVQKVAISTRESDGSPHATPIRTIPVRHGNKIIMYIRKTLEYKLKHLAFLVQDATFSVVLHIALKKKRYHSLRTTAQKSSQSGDQKRKNIPQVVIHRATRETCLSRSPPAPNEEKSPDRPCTSLPSQRTVVPSIESPPAQAPHRSSQHPHCEDAEGHRSSLSHH